MISILKRIISTYFSTWWAPAAACLVSLAAFTSITAFAIATRPLLVAVSNTLFVCLAVAFVGVLCAAVWNLVKKRWVTGAVILIMLPLCLFAAFVAMAYLIVGYMFGSSEDHFADNLTIPQNAEIAEPLEAVLSVEPGGIRDSFQQDLLAALASPGGDEPTVTANLTSLASLQKNAPQVLRRYLATSPAWRVFREGGNVFATRRWMIGSQWRYNLHGYYTDHDIGSRSPDRTARFQSRFTIGLSGKPWVRTSRDATRMSAGQTAPLTLSKGNQMHESRCIIAAGDLVVEVFEQSEAKERRLTRAALAHVEAELAPLAAKPAWETIRAGLPPDSVREGDMSFQLRNSFQPGLYDSEIWVNPGEPGMLHLKAFEVTKGTPLSTEPLKEKSNEWVGWSDNRAELFFSNTHFTIYEGDWGKPYAARFEVWFAPDSGGPDRKLMEKVFKIEGWQR